MDSDTGVKILLGGTHLHGDTETLQHLAGAETHDVQTDDLLLGASADELVLCGALLLGVHHRVVHGREVGRVDLEVLLAVLLLGFGLGQAD